jgi:hypothetical protein
MKTFVSWLLVSAVLSLPILLHAQATGTINGSAFDSSGALIPGATITITNAGTNQIRTATTDDSGNYVVPLLPVGKYNVRVEKEGFAPFSLNEVTLQVNTTIQVNATLDVRSAAEQISVTGEAIMVQTTATNLVQVVDERRIVDLPLNGRNVLQLMTLSAGVSDRGAAGGTIQINTIGSGVYHVPVSINGSRGNATNFLLDNADNNDGYTNIAEPYPNPDAVQEFSVQTSTFDAQYGRGVGGVVNVVTRSGTNQVHGTAFNFLRNNKMNAANFFSGKDALKRNQFGATFGGPVVIPGVYDGKNRTFFFASYQGTIQRVATPATVRTAPSQAMKQGDLSAFLGADGTGAIHDPLAPSQYFPNNRIPVSRFDPVSARILENIPASADPQYQLRFGTPSQATDDKQWMFRGDHAITSKQRLTMRYFYLHYDRPWVTLPSNLLYVNPGQFGSAHNATVAHTYTISPRWLNEVSATFHLSTPTATPPSDLNASFDKFGARSRSIPGFETMDLGISNWSGITLGLGYYGPQTTYVLADNVSYATGKHSLRFGGEVKKYRLDIASYWMSGGTASFNGQLYSDPGKVNAGNSFGEFLLGKMSQWRQQSFWSERLYTNFVALYLQDDIRLTPKLTLNLGVRWDPKFDSTETSGKRLVFAPGMQSAVYPNSPRSVLYQGDKGFENKIIPSDWNNIAPRVGLAYQVMPNTVIRAAYGLFYDQYMSIFNNRSAAGEPFVKSALFVGPVDLVNPFGSGPVLDPTPIVPGKDFVFSAAPTWALPGQSIVAGYMQNWNVVVERQFASDMLVRAAYVGSKGTHLLHSPERNPAIYGPGATASNLNARRPYAGIAGMQVGESTGWSQYHALQTTFQKRWGRGLSVLANYTWSKSTDIASYATIEGNSAGPDPFNFNNNRGPSDFDIPHRFVVSGIVEHPKLTNYNPILRTVLGGWQSNFIWTAQSGTPITIASGVDNALTGVGGNFADLTGVDWRMPGGRSRGQEVLEWFNKAAFRLNAIGTIGTGRRNQLRSPGAWNADYSLFKNFPFTEAVRLQFRGELFNIFNHTRLGAPSASVTSTTFGRITSAYDPRIVQLGLKLIF